MTKYILEFDKYEDREDFRDALQGTNYKIALQEIADEIFRPHRKHGYSQIIEDLVDKCGTSHNQEWDCEVRNGYEVIEKLEEMFYQILEDNDIKLWE